MLGDCCQSQVMLIEMRLPTAAAETQRLPALQSAGAPGDLRRFGALGWLQIVASNWVSSQAILPLQRPQSNGPLTPREGQQQQIPSIFLLQILLVTSPPCHPCSLGVCLLWLIMVSVELD